MEKITVEDLQRIATMLETKHGITIVVMPNEFTRKGLSILMMHPDDVKDMNEAFKPVESPIIPLRHPPQ
jgi:hypothetical protein